MIHFTKEMVDSYADKLRNSGKTVGREVEVVKVVGENA